MAVKFHQKGGRRLINNRLRKKKGNRMKSTFAMLLLFIAVLATGCASNSELPVARHDFSGINLSGYGNCKGVFVVADIYDIGIGTGATGDIARGEIKPGDHAQVNGKNIIINDIQANEKSWRKAASPARVTLSFGNQISVTDLKENDVVCFN